MASGWSGLALGSFGIGVAKALEPDNVMKLDAMASKIRENQIAKDVDDEEKKLKDENLQKIAQSLHQQDSSFLNEAAGGDETNTIVKPESYDYKNYSKRAEEKYNRSQFPGMDSAKRMISIGQKMMRYDPAKGMAYSAQGNALASQIHQTQMKEIAQQMLAGVPPSKWAPRLAPFMDAKYNPENVDIGELDGEQGVFFGKQSDGKSDPRSFASYAQLSWLAGPEYANIARQWGNTGQLNSGNVSDFFNQGGSNARVKGTASAIEKENGNNPGFALVSKNPNNKLNLPNTIGKDFASLVREAITGTANASVKENFQNVTLVTSENAPRITSQMNDAIFRIGFDAVGYYGSGYNARNNPKLEEVLNSGSPGEKAKLLNNYTIKPAVMEYLLQNPETKEAKEMLAHIANGYIQRVTGVEIVDAAGRTSVGEVYAFNPSKIYNDLVNSMQKLQSNSKDGAPAYEFDPKTLRKPISTDPQGRQQLANYYKNLLTTEQLAADPMIISRMVMESFQRNDIGILDQNDTKKKEETSTSNLPKPSDSQAAIGKKPLTPEERDARPVSTSDIVSQVIRDSGVTPKVKPTIDIATNQLNWVNFTQAGDTRTTSERIVESLNGVPVEGKPGFLNIQTGKNVGVTFDSNTNTLWIPSLKMWVDKDFHAMNSNKDGNKQFLGFANAVGAKVGKVRLGMADPSKEDLAIHKKVFEQIGSTESRGTVRSIGVNLGDGFETLIPTIYKDNDGVSRLHSDEDAILRAKNTGEHLGKFSGVEDANSFARVLSRESEKIMKNLPGAKPVNQTKATINMGIAFGRDTLKTAFNASILPYRIGYEFWKNMGQAPSNPNATKEIVESWDDDTKGIYDALKLVAKNISDLPVVGAGVKTAKTNFVFPKKDESNFVKKLRENRKRRIEVGGVGYQAGIGKPKDVDTLNMTVADVNTPDGKAAYQNPIEPVLDKSPLYTGANGETKLTPEMFAIAQALLTKTYPGVYVPPEFAVAQLIQEGGFVVGSKPHRTNNPFNLGNTDDGSIKKFDSIQEAINAYYLQLGKTYLMGSNYEELLKDGGYKNQRGERYATDPNYETRLRAVNKSLFGSK